MKNVYTKKDFENLDFDSKCVILEALLTDDYFGGQAEINFYHPEGDFFDKLPETPPEIKKIEDEKFQLLISRLTDKLFESQDKIEFDFIKDY
ncbi:hypothetical protein [Flavobacterium filum]|uniref:hypothetical protein n=1 Tax=Flavobacterium filum TaxID=370974 RepID=UPI0023EF6CE9|nr:hypothetical protein [Flavobacterium filum]